MKALSKIFLCCSPHWIWQVAVAVVAEAHLHSPRQVLIAIAISAASTSISTNTFTALTITVKKADGTIENDGTTVNASVGPSTIGTVSGAAGQAAGTTATNTLSGGKTSFNFTSSNQAGTRDDYDLAAGRLEWKPE